MARESGDPPDNLVASIAPWSGQSETCTTLDSHCICSRHIQDSSRDQPVFTTMFNSARSSDWSVARVSCVQDTRLAAGATFSQPLSAVVRSTSPTVKYLQGCAPPHGQLDNRGQVHANWPVTGSSGLRSYASAWALQRIP